MKESPTRYVNPFLSDEENKKVNFSTNPDDGKFQKSLEPSNIPLESLEKAKELYIDKNVTDCQIPESGFHVVKDICVDEGLSHEEMIKCDEEHHKLSRDLITVNEDKHDNMIKVDLDTDTQLVSSPLEDCYENTSLFSVTEDDNVTSNCASDEIKLVLESNNNVNSSEDFGPNKAMQKGEDKLDSSFDSLDNSINIQEPSNNGVNDANQQASEAQSIGSESNEPRETNDAIDPPHEIKMNENATPDSDNVKPTTASGPHELVLDTQDEFLLNQNAVASNSITVVSRGGGESSFSMADPVSGHITYSGPITSCGSISHRSDGSNSSVRSFAFPILQNEWNSSPVRLPPMHKQILTTNLPSHHAISAFHKFLLQIHGETGAEAVRAKAQGMEASHYVL